MNTKWSLSPVEPLMKLSGVMGGVAPDWASHEELSQLRYSGTFTSEIATGLQLDDLSPLVQSYGEALFCQFLLGDQIVLEVNQLIGQELLDQFHEAIAGVQQVTLELRIDKTRLGKDWFGDLFAQCQFPNQLFLYLFPTRLEEFLDKSTLTQLEERLWRDRYFDRIVLLVPGQDILTIGHHILVIGGKFLLDPPESVYEIKVKDINELDRVYHDCQDGLKWQKPWVAHLTPWHLYTESDPLVHDQITKTLKTHFINLFLLYTADRTVEKETPPNDKRLVSSYTTSQQALDIALEKAGQFDTTTIRTEDFSSLLRIFEWAYDPQWNASDRLPIVQISIVEALKGSLLPYRFKRLLENAVTILENTNWHWKAFIEDKIEVYLDQVQSLEEKVGQTVNVYSEQINSIISSLTETMLAAVGVLLGSFIAALFQDKFNPVVFRIGLITYGFYVLFFPLLYNMKNRWEAIQTIEKEFDAQRGWFDQRLPSDRVNTIIEKSQISENKKRFKKWFWLTAAILVILGIAAFLGAWIIPNAFQASSLSYQATPFTFLPSRILAPAIPRHFLMSDCC